jgi:hypothetical protein
MRRLRLHPRLLVVLGLLGHLTTSACATTDNQLHYADDEATIERQVNRYLQNKGLKTSMTQKDGDEWVQVSFNLPDLPRFVIQIDTSPSARDKSGRPNERVILIRLLSHVNVKTEAIPIVLPLLNHHHNKFWAGIFEVHESDNQIIATWPINLEEAEDGVPAAMVFDSMSRMITSWRQLHEELLKCPSCLQQQQPNIPVPHFGDTST